MPVREITERRASAGYARVERANTDGARAIPWPDIRLRPTTDSIARLADCHVQR
jgi:hypothetical protein